MSMDQSRVRGSALNLLSIAVVAALAGAAAPAMAQDAAAQAAKREAVAETAREPDHTGSAASPVDLDKVEVVAQSYRESLAKSLDEKRYSVEQVDAIYAEDIGKFPDLNLAESLQRIAGVAIDREGGEGKQISVRGLGPEFTRVRLNGLEALSTAGSGTSGVNRGRGFDFNTFASELFSEVKVSKSQSAQMDEGSLGATVDLRGARPFDYKGFKASASGQYGYNDLSKKKDPRLSALISNTFLDGRLGALMSASYSERNIVQEGYDYVRWEPGNRDANETIPVGFCSPLGYDPQNPRSPTAAESANSATSSGYGQYGIDESHCGYGVDRPAATAENIDAYETISNSNMPIYPRYLRSSYSQKRLGLTGALQWKIDDDTQLNFDALYSRLERDQQESSIEAVLYRNASYGGRSQIVANAAEVDDQNRLIYADLDNVDFRTETTAIKEKTEFKQFTLNLEHKFNEDARVDVILGHSQSDFDRPVNTMVSFDKSNVDGYVLDMRDSKKTPTFTIPFDVTDPSQWQWRGSDLVDTTATGVPMGSNASEIRLNPSAVSNGYDTAKVDFTFLLNPTFTLRTGLAYKDYDMTSTEYRNVTWGRVQSGLPDGVSVADISTLVTGFGSGLDGNPIDSWLIPDVDKIAELLGIYCNCVNENGDYRLSSIGHYNSTGANYEVNEKSMAAYLQLDFNTDFIDRPLRGNLGVRVVNTRISASGWAPCQAKTAALLSPDCEYVFGVASSSADPGLRPMIYSTVGNNYTDVLPSLNLAWDAREDLVLRFGASKTMARPTLSYMAPGMSGGPNQYVSGDTTKVYAINIGNPMLKPFRSTNYDFSAEWYFRPNSLLSLSLFYKDIKSYIQQARVFKRWADTGYSLDLLPAGFTEDTLFNVNTYVNTEGGPLKGFEVGYQQPFDFLPGIWSRFGIQLNYTRVKSKMQYVFSTKSSDNLTVYTTDTYDDLLNLSPTSYNATLYYDDGKFSARVSGAYRDGYLTGVQAVEIVEDLDGNEMRTPDITGKDSVLNVDFNMSYRIGNNLTLTFEAINLLDTYESYYYDSALQMPSRYLHTGRQYYAGLRYTF